MTAKTRYRQMLILSNILHKLTKVIQHTLHSDHFSVNSFLFLLHYIGMLRPTAWNLIGQPSHCPHLNVRVIFACGTPLPCATLFLAMLVELRVAQDGDSPAVVDQRERRAAVQTFLVCTWDGQDHRHRQVNNPTYKRRSEVSHTKYISHTKAPSNRQLFKGPRREPRVRLRIFGWGVWDRSVVGLFGGECESGEFSRKEAWQIHWVLHLD